MHSTVRSMKNSRSLKKKLLSSAIFKESFTNDFTVTERLSGL